MVRCSVVYLEARDCLLALRSRIRQLRGEPEPLGFSINAAAESSELYQRANWTFFRAMLTGSLRGWFVDGDERWQIPGWAWADQGGDWRGLISEDDFLHPLSPPDVRRWAWLPVLVERAEFKQWVVSDEVPDQTGFPELPPAYDEASRLPYVTRLEPPDRPNVSLSQALSWLAFNISLDARDLASALGAGVLGASRTDARRRLEQATDRLVTAGTGGLPMLGKFVPMVGDYGAALTARIEPERLEDFRQFDVTFDGLRYGTGVSWDWTDPGVTVRAQGLPGTTHKYVDVRIERRGLMALSRSEEVPTGEDEMSGDNLPSDDVIFAKMHELWAIGLSRDEAAKRIRTLPGFEQVGNEHARRLVNGTLPRGRPKGASRNAAGKSAG